MDNVEQRPAGLTVNTSNENYQWSEIRLQGKLPERRSNHCSFIVQDHLYVHGGRELEEGPMANMWRLSISGIHSLIEDPDYGVTWEPVAFKGQGVHPGKISHHKPAVFGHTVVVFGGINDYDNTKEAFEFDSNKNVWTKLKQSGEVPKSRDDHSLSQIDDTSFMIFGGFVEGSRVNEAFVAKKNGNTLEWKKIAQNSPTAPCIRASHSSTVYNGKAYVFGGQDDDNNKLNDLWELDLATETYRSIELPQGSSIPMCRSGQTSNIYNGQLYIFGGILELTKELNDMLIYDFKTGKFQSIGGDGQQDEFNSNSVTKVQEQDSPGLKMRKQATMAGGNSPTKIGNGGTFASPSKKTNASPTKLTAKARRAGKSPKKSGDGAVESKDKKESGLASPTSISMQNSFIIKNADESFDAYWGQMRRRKIGQGNTNMDGTSGGGGNSATLPGGTMAQNQSSFGVVGGIQPAARDGHTTEISSDGLMFVFGGDRHHMPFNDLYMMKLN